MGTKQISVILPVYNEENCIAELLDDIEKYVEAPLEFILVNDGSTDGTLKALKEHKTTKKGNSKKIIDLSRNFGHQYALMCGLENVSIDSDIIIVMDSDFQDLPQDIPKLLNKLKEGYDCVYAIRQHRHENLLLKVLSNIFYKIQTKIASFSIPRDAGIFSIFNKNVHDKILLFSEVDIYFPALRAYVGYRQTGLPLDRGKRSFGTSRVGFKGLVDLSLIALLDFSAMPIRLIFVFGIFIMFFCILACMTVFIMKVLGITKIPGVTTVIILIMSFAGIQIMFLGIVGEYIRKMFSESKKRPRWIVKEIIG